MSQSSLKMIDIGVNLTDSMYQGWYNEKQAHESDIDKVISRSSGVGIRKMIVTAGSLSEFKKALEMVASRENLYTTVGVHPTRCNEFELPTANNSTNSSSTTTDQNPQAYLNELVDLTIAHKSKVVAVGEFGLDYDRTKFCDKETQIKFFKFQFQLAEKTKLPLFLHLRNAFDDFIKIIEENRSKFKHGVVHSFDGTKEELKKLLELNLYIGINGCSLKTEHNLQVVKDIPLNRLMIETDAPWCQVRQTHAGFKYVKTKFSEQKKEKFKMGDIVKGRNEPVYLIQILEILCSIYEQPIDTLAQSIYQNTIDVFFPEEKKDQ